MQFLITMLDPASCSIQPALKKDVSAFLKSLTSGRENKPEKNRKAGNNVKAGKDTKSTKDAKDGKDANARKGSKEQKSPAKSKDVKQTRTRKDHSHEEQSVEAAHAPIPTANKGRTKLIFSATAHWYSAIPPLKPQEKGLPTPSTAQASSLSERAQSLITTDADVYQASSAFTGNSASDSHFLQTILSKGTLSDRLSALTLLVQASPVHNSKALETLKSMAERGRGKGGREEGLKAMRCVVDWWVGGGAPSRKLRYGAYFSMSVILPDI